MKLRLAVTTAVLAVSLLFYAHVYRASIGDTALLSVAAAASSRSERFGITGGTAGAESSSLLQELGVGWMRIPVRWDQIEPHPGVYRWKQVEEALAQHERSDPDLRIMVTVRAVSPWAGGKSSRGPQPKATLPPRDLNAYYQFMFGLASRGRAIVNCWQIENEEDSPSWWAGTAEQYLELLRTAHRAIRAADPNVKIALGGFTSELTTVAALAARGVDKTEIARQLGSRGPVSPKTEAYFRAEVDFMDAVLAGAGDSVDVVDIHLYNDYRTIPARVEWLRERMRVHGYEKPIWSTEVGGPDTQVESYSEKAQAMQMVKRAALALGSGVQKVFWLGLFELQGEGARFDHLGLVTARSRKKPAFLVYQALQRAIDDLPCVFLSVPGGYGVRFGQGTGARWVLWSEALRNYHLEVGRSAVRVTHIDGRTQILPTREGAADLALTDSPILVEPVLQ